MNIKYLILCLLTSLSQSLYSQENNKFSLTIEFSANMSNLTDEVINERYKLSHNATLRISYNTKGKVEPTIGLGFINTGELERYEIDSQGGIEFVKFIHNYNYFNIPIGAKFNLGRFYFLPELGIGLNFSNKDKKILEFTNGETEKLIIDPKLISGEFNKLSIPISISIGTDFKLSGKTISTGLKGYYGLNQIVKDVQRNNHYFGFGLILALNL